MIRSLKNMFLVSLLIFLSSCSDSGSENATLSSLAGVWDSTTTEDSLVDEYYTVMKIDGTVVDYDYMGDSFDNGPNCYLSDAGTIVDLGNGDFIASYNSGRVLYAHITISGNTLYATTQYGSGTSVKTNLLESDFTPACL